MQRLIQRLRMTVPSLAIVACQSAAIDTAPGHCPDSDATAPACILEAAIDAAGTVTDAGEQATLDVELAKAELALGEPELAIARMKGALGKAMNTPQQEVRAELLVTLLSAVPTPLCAAIHADDLMDAVQAQAAIDNADKRADKLGRLIATAANCTGLDRAIQDAVDMGEGSDAMGAYKARTLHDIAPVIAQRQGVATATRFVERITMGIPYYRAIAANEVARIAHRNGDGVIAEQLLAMAERVGRDEKDGYFSAGILREVAASYEIIGDSRRAQTLFDDAVSATANAASAQHRARALSRVATVLSDVGLYAKAQTYIPDAVAIASGIEVDALRYWSYYEIVGGAAFSGDFESATMLLERIPPDTQLAGSSLYAAAARDLSWGYAKHGHIDAALNTAKKITSARERVQALTRIVRVIADPTLHALPRYL